MVNARAAFGRGVEPEVDAVPGWGPDPGMQPTLAAHLYGSSEAWTRERAAVFGRAWLFLGHEAEAPEAGDWIAADIAGHRLVMVRGGDGSLRAFHNVCRHRAGPLVVGERGSCEGELVCRYHGWRYALDGRLRSAVGFGPDEGFDPREFGLFGVRLEVWRGLAFVNLDADADPLTDIVAPLEGLLGERGLSIAAPALRRSHVLDCDWKVYVENYLEGYHIGAVHPVLAEELGGADYRVRVEGEVVVQEAVGLEGGPQAGLWGWLWPNLGVNAYRDGAMIERMTPDGPGRTRLDYLYLSDEGPDAVASAIAASERLTAEDADICAAVQKNLSAGAYDRGVLSPRHETAVGWFQGRIAKVHA